jgi:hypothetical protein
MSIPTKSDLLGMDLAYLGQPFVNVPSKCTTIPSTMDYSYMGQPFVGNLSYFGTLKRWTGSVWVKAKLKVRNGGSWIIKPLKIFDNTEWKAIDNNG